jgi:hypothetical protein
LELIGIVNYEQNSSGSVTKRMENKWDYMKLQSFCTIKEMITKLKRLPTEWEKIFASYTSDKGFITRIYRSSKN